MLEAADAALAAQAIAEDHRKARQDAEEKHVALVGASGLNLRLQDDKHAAALHEFAPKARLR